MDRGASLPKLRRSLGPLEVAILAIVLVFSYLYYPLGLKRRDKVKPTKTEMPSRP